MSPCARAQACVLARITPARPQVGARAGLHIWLERACALRIRNLTEFNGRASLGSCGWRGMCTHGPLRPATSSGTSKAERARRKPAPQRGRATWSLPLGRWGEPLGPGVMRSESGQVQGLRHICIDIDVQTDSHICMVMRSESGQVQGLRQAGRSTRRRALAGLGGEGTGVVDGERRARTGRNRGRVRVENQCRAEGAMRRGMMRRVRRLSLTRRRATSATSSLSASVLIKGIAHAPDSCVHAGH